MNLSKRAKELMLIAALLALPVLLLRAHLKSPSDLSFVDRGVLWAVGPVERAGTAVGRFGSRIWSHYAYLVHVAKENEQLKRERATQSSEIERLKIEAVRVADLERLLGLKNKIGQNQTIAARVVGVQTSAFFRVLRVRLELEGNEVKAGMPVLASSGVVGRIERVFGNYADVLLAVDPKSAIDVVVPSTRVRGILKGIASENAYRARIEYLERKDEVKEGDVVVTSGLGAFPRGVPVGVVAKVTRREFGLYQEAEIKPAVDFSRLDQVLIVTDDFTLAQRFEDPSAKRKETR